MIIFAIFRLFFIISAFFILLAIGLGLSLAWKMRLGMMRGPFPQGSDPESRRHYGDGGKIIEGEYKVLEDPKDK